MRALEAALNAVWAMETNALETLLTIAAREHEVPTPEALEAYRAKTLADAETATIRDGVAIIKAEGPMIKRGNMFSAMSGATSYDVLARDIGAARADTKVKAAILYLDTPGGEASGAGELAGMVKAFAAEKPIIAYVSGMAASAGYWLASGATEIVVDPSAFLGSIGAQMALGKRDDPKGVTTYRFVSSQSPMKNADPSTEAGAEHMQGVVNALAQVFINDVATNRGVATETVLSDFGKGGIFVGQDAVNAGLADRIGNFEGVLAELAAAPRRKTPKAKGATMSDEATFTAAERDAFVATARAAEKTRVANLRLVASGMGASDAELTAAIDGDVTVEAFSLTQSGKAAAQRDAASAAAAATAAATAAADAVRLQALKDDEEAAAKVVGAPATDADAATALDTLVAGVSAFIPADRRGK